jgi:hypothetical protein
MTKTEAAQALGISKRQLERRVRRGKIKCSHDAQGVAVFDRADLGLPPEPETAPLAGDSSPDLPKPDPVVPPPMTLAQQVEELDAWTVDELLAARLKWCLPDDPSGVPTNAPAYGSSTMPNPVSYALFTRANAILLDRQLRETPAPRVPRPRYAQQRAEVSRDCALHNSRVSGCGSDIFSRCWEGTK